MTELTITELKMNSVYITEKIGHMSYIDVNTVNRSELVCTRGV